MNGIKPLDTLYDGHYFRSRTEARWAVFFNALGIKYEYEPEGYKLEDGTCYLPDFWLPDVYSRCAPTPGIWFEVKGSEPSDDDMRKMSLLCKLLGNGKTYCGIIAVGVPGTGAASRYSYNPLRLYESSWQMHEYREDLTPSEGIDTDMKLCRCSVCGKLHFEWDKWDRYDCCYGSGTGALTHDAWDALVRSATNTAVRARFEHGQKG